MPTVNDGNPRDTATLVASTSPTTLWIACWNARQVTFLLSATNGVIPAWVVEASNDAVNIWNDTTQPSLADLGVLVTGLAGGVPLNAGEIPVIVTPVVGVTLMAISYLRLKFTAAETDTIGLRVRAAVITDSTAGTSTQAVL